MSNAEQPRKSSGMKILLWIVVVLVLLAIVACVGCLGLGAYMAKNLIITDPAKVQSTAESITAMTPPPGYDAKMGMNMMGVMTMAMYGDSTSGGDHMLMLMSFQAGVDEQQMESQMKDNLEQQGGNKNISVTETTEETYQVRGEETAVTIEKGESGGKEFRQIYFTFTSKGGGPAMFMMVMPEEEWADDGKEAFEATLASMQNP